MIGLFAKSSSYIVRSGKICFLIQSSTELGSGAFYRPNNFNGRPIPPPTTTRRDVLKEPDGAPPTSNFKRITESEIQNKRAKGLCFRCDEKFTPGHRCKDRSLQVLTVCDDGEDKSLAGEDEEDVEVEEHPHLDSIEVSLNSVVGFTPSHTMKIKGTIGEREVTVLVDSGATHNFIASRVVRELDI